MDFITTARFLMDLREKIGPFHYRFGEHGTLLIELCVEENVAQLFEDATKMFEPA